MGNNAEIRKRMETYRTILLVLNWIMAVALIIVGIVLANSRYTQGIGIGVIIGSVVLGIIGHFLVNVTLAIPFILLNNGDILESMKVGSSSNSVNAPPSGSSHFQSERERSRSTYSGDMPSPGEAGDEYIVAINTPLRGDSEESSYIVKPLKAGDKVYFQYAVNNKPNWFYVKTADSQNGWCLADNLKKA